MPTITDEEFGTITLRRSAKATQVRIKIAPDGRLRASLPLYAPLFLVKRLIKTSRPQLRALIAKHHTLGVFTDGMQLGKSHTIVVRPTQAKEVRVARHGQQIIVSLPDPTLLQTTPIQRMIRDEAIKALRLEAKNYLPRRLAFLADIHGYSYQKVRFSHSSGRWGSCSSEGTISLNIALMKLPFELIDYVLIHELSHTKQMNHSRDFWNLVEQADPKYKLHKNTLKTQTPSI